MISVMSQLLLIFKKIPIKSKQIFKAIWKSTLKVPITYLKNVMKKYFKHQFT